MLAGLLLVSACHGQTVVIDNDNANNTDGVFAVISGTWSTGTSAPGHWANDYRYTAAGGALSAVEWRPDLPAAEEYEVSVYYPEGSNRTPDAPFTIYHADGDTTVFVDQRTNGGQWLSLGTYVFAAGTDGYVTLDDDASTGAVIADAVRFQVVAPGAPALRGVWIDAFGSGFKSRAEIDTLISRALTGRYNAIFPEVLAYQDTSASDNGHGAFWHSAIVPWASVVTADFDPLAYLCAQAHANGIEVHAWLVTYRVSTSWPPAGNTTITAHPEWIMVPQADMGGGPARVDDKYVLDPGSPDVQDYVISIVRELVSDYEIDGVHFDYIRYTSKDAGYPSDEDYDNSSLARYRRLTGYGGTPAPTDGDWSDFRRRGIDELIRRCRAEIPSIPENPRQPLRLTAALFAAGSAPADFADSSAYYLHQNWKHWLEMGWLDAACPMNYKDERNASHAGYYRSWIDAAVSYRGARHVYCGQGNYLNSKANSITQLEYVYEAGANGSMNYSYRSTADEDDDGNSEADWSWYSYVADALFIAPAPTPPMPWRDPSTATEGTLWGRVMHRANGQPLDDVAVAVAGQAPVRTDGNGYYVATLIPADALGTPYDVTASLAGWPDEADSAVVLAGDVARLDFALGDIVPGDFDGDGDVDSADLDAFGDCASGPDHTPSDDHCLAVFDFDEDADVDLHDLSVLLLLATPNEVVDVVVEVRDAGGAIEPPPTYDEIGSWADSSVKSAAPGLTGSGSRYINYVLPNNDSDNATFVPAIATPGVYELFVTWGTGANCYDAQYTVRHADGTAVMLVDQIPTGAAGENDNRWVSLGQYRFDAGQSAVAGSINVSEELVSGRPHSGWNQRVYADAAKWVFITP